MITQEAYKKLMYDIRLRMAGNRTLLDSPELRDDAIDQLRFLIVLLTDIGTKESLDSAQYIKGLIQKALNGTIQIGD